MQCCGVGRGHRSVSINARAVNAKCAKACSVVVERFPQLPCEMNGRAFAVRTGDGGDEIGLFVRVKFRRHLRETTARVVVGNQFDVGGDRRSDLR